MPAAGVVALDAMADHIRDVVNAAPPLTTEQRMSLGNMLTVGGAR